ncbi:hypothetical protein H2200_010401 [Cladophialophora chaetospira]|uniref:GST N-terminal domain-containing protein n=1 Tax=Cladophialophora chaetospira TaxID=386627 RepID=A0AA38X1J7_9EURO|nr:hypothetical protein H2200_010401 [Cladophialophora chaetospira]
MSQSNGHPAKYELYYNPFSICSLMVLYTLRLKGRPKSPNDAVDPEEIFTDIYAGDQMTEEYLLKHPKGHVPALLAPSLNVQLTDSTDITTYLMDRYPSLRPEAHRQTIEDLLAELHEISYVTLSFKPEERRVEGVMDKVREIQNRPDTSERYRKLLQVKYDNHAASLANFTAKNQSVSSVEADSTRFFSKINALLSAQGGHVPWLFGDQTGPTALDAHTLVFVARLLDAKREHLVPRDVLAWWWPKAESKEWKSFFRGTTLHSVYVREHGGELEEH